jgi:TonB family protein
MTPCARIFAGVALGVAMAAAVADEQVTAVSVSTLAAASAAAVEISRPLPTYPIGARRNGYHHGRVLLGYDVAADGSVQNVRVLEAFPVQVYTRTAVNAVQRWRYAPGTGDRRMVEFNFVCD